MLDEKSSKPSTAPNAVTAEHSHAMLIDESGPVSVKKDPPPKPPGPPPDIEPPERRPNDGPKDGRLPARPPYSGLRTVNGPLRGGEEPPPPPPDDITPVTRGPRPR